MLKFSEILDFLVYSNIYISLAALSISYLLYKIEGIAANYVLIIPFIVIFTIYNINRKTDENEDRISDPRKFEFNKKYNQYILAIAIVGYFITAIMSFKKGFIYGVAVLLPFLIGILYSKGWFPTKSKMIRLKDIFFLKNIIVAITWAYTAIILPAIFLNLSINQEMYVLITLIFLRVLIGAIFFDIKDIDGDSKAGIKTIPVVYGLGITNHILTFLNISLLYTAIIMYLAKTHDPALSKILLSSGIYGLFYTLLYWSDSLEINKLSNVFVDGEFIAIGIITHITTSL